MSKIEQQVMAGVAVAYALRKLTSRTALECYALFVCAFIVTFFVSLPHVFQNLLSVAEGGIPTIMLFLFSAVVGTKLLVQVALGVGAVALMTLARDLARARPQVRLA